MATPVIVGAARTAIGRSFKGTLVNTPPETLITAVLPEVVRRSGVDPADIDDIIFAESHYGGGDLARYAATATGLEHVPGQSVNRHCAGSLTAIGNASAQIGSGMVARQFVTLCPQPRNDALGVHQRLGASKRDKGNAGRAVHRGWRVRPWYESRVDSTAAA